MTGHPRALTPAILSPEYPSGMAHCLHAGLTQMWNQRDPGDTKSLPPPLTPLCPLDSFCQSLLPPLVLCMHLLIICLWTALSIVWSCSCLSVWETFALRAVCVWGCRRCHLSDLVSRHVTGFIPHILVWVYQLQSVWESPEKDTVPSEGDVGPEAGHPWCLWIWLGVCHVGCVTLNPWPLLIQADGTSC